MCERRADCQNPDIATVRELAQDQQAVNETRVCARCLDAWMTAESQRFIEDELVIVGGMNTRYDRATPPS